MNILYYRHNGQVFKRSPGSVARELSPKEIELLVATGVHIFDVICLKGEEGIVIHHDNSPTDTTFVKLQALNGVFKNNVPAYFAFDGADGVGKSTFLKQLKTFLESKGYRVALVREPGETYAGKILREKILESDLGIDANLELFVADRILTQQLVIKPMLMSGTIVISDRSLLSTIVYQGFPSKRQDEIIDIHRNIQSFLMPTLGFVCQLDYETCRDRLNQRSQKEDNNHFDYDEEKIQKERHHYYNRAHEWSPFPIRYLHFSRETQTLNEEVLRYMLKFINHS